jgi:hypothetical protein
VIQLKAVFQTKAHITDLAADTDVFFFRALSTQHISSDVLIFLVLGTTFLRKCLSVNRGTVLSDACRPGTLRTVLSDACPPGTQR